MGAGPAGLTAAYELLIHTDIQPIIFEQSIHLGGLSKTIDYKGNKIDIGGHRFYSKSDRVMEWWLNILPLEYDPDQKNSSFVISYQNQSRKVDPKRTAAKDGNKVMLVRDRKSRIFFRKKLFDYPLRLNLKTIQKLGFFFSFKVLLSYVQSSLTFKTEEKTLEDFFIRRFGRKLYDTFFKDYTEKVWGVACKDIDASWGAQRIKGLSIRKALSHALRSGLTLGNDSKKTETSLIEKFLYPKLGPGQLWQEVGRLVMEKGGVIETNSKVIGLSLDHDRIDSVSVLNTLTGGSKEIRADYFISTIPVRELINSMGDKIPQEIKKTADGLVYRDFITVGLLLNKLSLSGGSNPVLNDTWLYVQEKGLKMGRIQFFNNWSPYMISDPDKFWVGLEYFCNEGDELWNKTENEMRQFAIEEFQDLGFIHASDVLDGVVIKEAKAYPSYTGTYQDFSKIRHFTDRLKNLFLIGRNGMHRYNNQDHSMLTAMITVEHIQKGIKDKTAIWEVNSEENYLEEN